MKSIPFLSMFGFIPSPVMTTFLNESFIFIRDLSSCSLFSGSSMR